MAAYQGPAEITGREKEFTTSRVIKHCVILRFYRYGSDEASLASMTQAPTGGFGYGCPAINIMRAYERTHFCSNWLAHFAQRVFYWLMKTNRKYGKQKFKEELRKISIDCCPSGGVSWLLVVASIQYTVQLIEVLYHSAAGNPRLIRTVIYLCGQFFLENKIEKWIKEQGGYAAGFCKDWKPERDDSGNLKVSKCKHLYHCDKKYPVLLIPKLFLIPGEETQPDCREPQYWMDTIVGQRALVNPSCPVVPQGTMQKEQAQGDPTAPVFRERTEDDPKPLFLREPKQPQSAPLQQHSPPAHQQQTPPHQQQSASLQQHSPPTHQQQMPPYQQQSAPPLQQSVPQQVLPAPPQQVQPGPTYFPNIPGQVYYPCPQSQGQPAVIIGPVTYYGQQQAEPGHQGPAPQQVFMPQMGQAYQQGQQGQIYYGQQQAGLGQLGPVPQQVLMPQTGQAYQQGQQGQIHLQYPTGSFRPPYPRGVVPQGPMPYRAPYPQIGQAYQQRQQGQIHLQYPTAGIRPQYPRGVVPQGAMPYRAPFPQMRQAYQHGQQGQIHLQYPTAGIRPQYSSGQGQLGSVPQQASTPQTKQAYQQEQQEEMDLENPPVGITPIYSPGQERQSPVPQQAQIPQIGQACQQKQQGQMGIESLENDERAE